MLPDPRQYPSPSSIPETAARCHAWAQASLAAAIRADSDASDARIVAQLSEWVRCGNGEALGEALACAPSVDVHRHLSRMLARALAADGEGEGLAITLFAVPVVLVAATQQSSGAPATLSAVLSDPRALAALMKDAGALAGNRTLALANVLVAADALSVARLPALVAAARLPGPAGRAFAPLALAPAPLAIAGGTESAHLRFLVGSALAAPGADLFRPEEIRRWGMPLAEALGRELRAPGVAVTAIPRAARPLAAAAHGGRSAQREVAAMLFASNALRRLRAQFGEPTAVISAHRLADGRGEVRLSLSTPFDPREAEGFRVPLDPDDRVGDVAAMLIDLLRDCRVTDIRVVDGVHPDRDPANQPLLFKPDTIPSEVPVTVH